MSRQATLALARIVAATERGAGQEPAPAPEPRRSKTGRKLPEGAIRCDRCSGRGTYWWGGTINGRPIHSGPCFQCGEKGWQSPEDQKRNANYQRFAMARLA